VNKSVGVASPKARRAEILQTYFEGRKTLRGGQGAKRESNVLEYPKEKKASEWRRLEEKEKTFQQGPRHTTKGARRPLSSSRKEKREEKRTTWSKGGNRRTKGAAMSRGSKTEIDTSACGPRGRKISDRGKKLRA